MYEYTLIGGPQDGAKVVLYDDRNTIYVGPKWLGDGYAAYSTEHSGRFSVCYEKRDKFNFVCRGTVLPF